MSEQMQINIQTVSDLELAELLSQQQAQAYQSQSNVAALLAELERRKKLVVKTMEDVK